VGEGKKLRDFLDDVLKVANTCIYRFQDFVSDELDELNLSFEETVTWTERAYVVFISAISKVYLNFLRKQGVKPSE